MSETNIWNMTAEQIAEANKKKNSPEYYTVSVKTNEIGQVISWSDDVSYGMVTVNVPYDEWEKFDMCSGHQYRVEDGSLVYDEGLEEIKEETPIDDITRLELAITELYERVENHG